MGRMGPKDPSILFHRPAKSIRETAGGLLSALVAEFLQHGLGGVPVDVGEVAGMSVKQNGELVPESARHNVTPLDTSLPHERRSYRLRVGAARQEP
jgi:hypothetical protein